MKAIRLLAVLCVLMSLFLAINVQAQCCQKMFNDYCRPIHDKSRPQPEVINPGTPSSLKKAGQPPSDAIILFSKDTLDEWLTRDGQPADWNIKGDTFECVPEKATIYTKKKFGDCQLHVEFATPKDVKGKGQGRGNSGVYLMGKYEVQILDNYENQTYPDGQATALYGQTPPMVNACRKPGEWQTYDIIFHRPRFSSTGDVIKPATMTVIHNGVLVQDHTELTGPTTHTIRMAYHKHECKLPVSLQNHSNPVRFRNIWIRDLEKKCCEDKACCSGKEEKKTVDVSQFAGTYFNEKSQEKAVVVEKEGKLSLEFVTAKEIPLTAQANQNFFAQANQLQIRFDYNKEGKISNIRLIQYGKESRLKKVE